MLQVDSLVQKMTLEEKASLCSGLDFWHTKPIERLGIPSELLTDGPHGLRKQANDTDHLGFNESKRAVCFPAGCATASSFNKELIRKMGETLGEECQAENISVILGPAMNIKRSPLCGRNFEYYSEDPYVSSELAGALINGIQSKGVGACPKHFLANNQEYHRRTSSSDMDERTLREIYLSSFEGMVKKEKPWTIMNSYNRLNGTYLCENKEMLTDILRKEWGFDGYVVTDWGAMTDRVNALKAGCNLEMPASGGVTDEDIISAVQNGELDEEILDSSCKELLNVIIRCENNRLHNVEFNYERDHQIAREVEEECIVLMKNEENILPLTKEKNVAFIGKYASNPRYQGGGSSHVNSFRVESALECVDSKVSYAQGFDDVEDKINSEMLEEAVRTAKAAEAAVIFAGLPDVFESEGYDRTHMQLPKCQNEIIERVAEVQPNTIVVLHNGAPVEMPWIHKVKAVLEAYLGGQAVGGAVVNVLYGKVNPSGHLAETFPLRLEDTPCYLTYGGAHDRSPYSEGIFVGYRYYASKRMNVLFPFGHGLSYTTFSYTNLSIEKDTTKEGNTLSVTVDVTNTGALKGKEVVQLYVAPKGLTEIRPIRELKRFEKIELLPGETKHVKFELNSRDFSYWNTQIHDWYVESGTYEIQIGKNAMDIVLSKSVDIKSETTIKKVFSLNSPMGEILADERGKVLLEKTMFSLMGADMQTMKEQYQGDAINKQMIEASMNAMPLREIMFFVPGVTKAMLNCFVDELNNER